MASYRWRTRAEDNGLGLAEAVSTYLGVPKEEAADLIDFGSVYVRGRIERNPSMVLAGEEEISVTFASYGTRRSYQIDPARIIFRDRFLLAYDKEAGIPSQQVPYDAYNNVYAALLRRLEEERTDFPCSQEQGEGSVSRESMDFLPASRRPGPLPAPIQVYAALHHRLDMETSGVLLFTLERKVNESLGRAFRERRVMKEYLAWIEGVPKNDSWNSDSDIGKIRGKYTAVRKGEGKAAETLFRVLRREEGRAMVLASPLTGRTHQIRIHLAEAGHPVLGDRAYGARPDKRLYLHAWRLALKHPVSGKLLSVEAPVPVEMMSREQ